MRGIAEPLGLVSFRALPDPAQLLHEFERMLPVPPAALAAAADLAKRACTEFLSAAVTAVESDMEMRIR